MNKVKKNLRRYVCFCLCLFMVFTLFPFAAEAKETKKAQKTKTEGKVVRVGWYEDSYHISGENGKRSGYGYEYEQAVAAYTGWKYEYVKGDWSELVEKLEKGEIDMMAALSYTDERAETMLFSDLPMGQEKYYLYANLPDTDISASNLSTLNGKRIVVMEKSVQGTQFAEWEEKNNIKTQHVSMYSFDEAKEAAEKGEIDGVISTETPAWVEAGMSAIAVTGGSDIYYGINKNRPDLKEELDSAMRKMESDKPFYADELYQRYLSAQSVAVLSSEEKEWIKKHGAIKIGYLKNDAGVSTLDSESGKPVGVINDYVDYAKGCLENSKLQFELEGFDTQKEELQALEDGKIDMIFHASQNPYASEKAELALSNTVWTENMVAVTGKNSFDENEKNSVAIAKDDLVQKWFVSYYYPEWKIHEYNSEEEAEKSVRDGKTDCFLQGSNQVMNTADEKKLHNVFLIQPDNISFAVKREIPICCRF